MLVQFAVSTAMLVLCVFVHGAGLFSLSRALRSERAVERLRHIDPLSRRGAVFTLAIMLAVFALHGIEIWAFTALYVGIGAIDTLAEALYFSTISYPRSVFTTTWSTRHGTLSARSRAFSASS